MPKRTAATRTPRPTDAELEILNVLWQRGPSTVREVHDALHRTRPTGYTTVLKLMQIMAEKQLVRRDERQRAHVYEAQLAYTVNSEGGDERQAAYYRIAELFEGLAQD